MPADDAARIEPNGKITTKQFYEKLLEWEAKGAETERRIMGQLEAQNKERAAMEARLLKELACKDDVATLKRDTEADISGLRTDVDGLKRNSYIWNGINSALVTLGAIIFGSKQ